MSLFKKLFGAGGPPETEAVTHEGFRIIATPIPEGGTYRVSATIEKDFGEETRQHKLIRADTVQGLETAQEVCVQKAKQVIDEQGDRIFQ